MRAGRATAVALPISVHQSHLSAAGRGVLRPALPVRARQRGGCASGGRAATVGSAAGPHILKKGPAVPLVVGPPIWRPSTEADEPALSESSGSPARAPAPHPPSSHDGGRSGRKR